MDGREWNELPHGGRKVVKKMKSCCIVIRVTEKNFKVYNPDVEIDDMRLVAYAQRVENFIRAAIEAENPLMHGGIFISKVCEVCPGTTLLRERLKESEPKDA